MTWLAPGLRKQGMVIYRGAHITRKPLHFDGEPDLFTRTRALFETTSRLQVRYAAPDRHKLRSDAAGAPHPASRETAGPAPALTSDIVWGR